MWEIPKIVKVNQSLDDTCVRVEHLKSLIQYVDREGVADLVDVTHIMRVKEMWIPRSYYDFENDTLTGEKPLWKPAHIPKPFLKFISKYYDRNKIEATLGKLQLKIDCIYSLAITHEDDNYNRKFGYYLAKLRTLFYYYGKFDHPLYNNNLITLQTVPRDEPEVDV